MKITNVMMFQCLVIFHWIFITFPGTSAQLPGNITVSRNKCIKCKSILDIGIAEKRRIDMLKKRIIKNLNVDISDNSNKRPKKRPQDTEKASPRDTPVIVSIESEIVSFSEKAGNASQTNVLSFTIDVSNNQGPIEAVSAHLWILVQKRRRGKSNGKRIVLQVMKIADNSSNYDYLTTLRTRVKKTRWQKISLPVTLIQSIIDSKNSTLQLRILCRKCGRVVRPVLFRKRKNYRKVGKGTSLRKLNKKTKSKGQKKKNKKTKKKKKKKKRKKKRKNKIGNFRDTKVWKTKSQSAIRPFLVISTRYKRSV